MTGPAFDRRRFLKGTAGAIPVALAGCQERG
ncbi:twin-arginine translocation signal domain-containing protein [Halovenus salina]|uniref:Twin-arginine translocation signal domain-containing protein n=1 Tax=Halovenus salina TaxID=1510225 RepID=A0ABD5W5C7_9EURY